MPLPRKRLVRFARCEDGSYSVEAVMILPLLLWVALASMTFIDGYRQQNANLRTTYTIADMLSRQSDPVGPRFVDGLGRIHTFLTQGKNETSLRVTVAIWNEPDGKHELVWSDSTGNAPAPITDVTLAQLSPSIPALSNGSTAIIVETWMDYEPVFKIGLSPHRFHHSAIVTPRFRPQLKYEAGA
ncbi:hypothetical protein [Palleronia sp. LCG004]|uniref:TadE/TadG family type IV pilus assembly protein n=1 Tax=Palleronia sp. LCG004 TaxID=3079304 RepID=UPI0029422AB2|nr:hypothetical protein [Palleronia sp. LCG004]WOI57053.1 hypothetical protein RVY76_04495 [Palleronia sp. LCG004]